MNYGIGNGGGFGVSIPLNGYGGSSAFNPYQGNSWRQQPITSYSQPNYVQTSGWGFTQPLNNGWTSAPHSRWSGQTYLQPQQTYYQAPQYSYPSIHFGSGCGNCGHTKPVIRRDW